ncbi:MAG TPA: hypothetical protein VL856_21100 [Acidimicrobiia bacterium]|jgi:hypothetical protein|nr:hypothetical protein [Acidimicrobiia bacterium]
MQRRPTISWDIDLYRRLQDDAWELDARAIEQDSWAKRRHVNSEGAANRTRAHAARHRAAELLALYWVFPRASATDRGHSER